jgi:hypothetical protein
MEKRLLTVLGAVAVAVVAVGLSAAATMTRGESAQPAKKTQSAKPQKKAVARTAQRKASDPAVTSSGPGRQSAKDVESYWTKERMADAQPMGQTRQGGTPSSSPAPTGTTAPGSEPAQKPTPQKSSTTKARADGVVTSGPAATPNPGYWTDETMDGAQPMEKTRPGGSGSQGNPGSGGFVAPGSPPS